MPIISQFYGITIMMFYDDNNKHKLPHLHAEYGEFDASYDINCKRLSGKLPLKQNKMVEAWILIHQKELRTLWNLMKKGKGTFKIDPLN